MDGWMDGWMDLTVSFGGVWGWKGTKESGTRERKLGKFETPEACLSLVPFFFRVGGLSL